MDHLLDRFWLSARKLLINSIEKKTLDPNTTNIRCIQDVNLHFQENVQVQSDICMDENGTDIYSTVRSTEQI